MAITYTGSNGLFTRLGKIFYVVEKINEFTSTLRAEVEDVVDEFTVADMYQLLGLPSKLKTIEAPLESLYGQLSLITRNMIIETVRVGLNKEPRGIQDALELLIEDMIAESKHVEDVNYSTNGTVAAVSASAGTGNVGTILVNPYQPKNISFGGTQTIWQTIIGEIIHVECAVDESGDALLGKEIFRVFGEEPKKTTDADWPGGSGINLLIPVTSAKETGFNRLSKPGENLLTNSDFQVWDASTDPSRWTATQMDSASVPGSAQTNNTTADYIFNAESSGNLRILGDGTYRHRIYQELGSGLGTAGRVFANRNYNLSCRIRIGAGSGTVGGGAITFNIQDSAGNMTSATKVQNLTSIGTSWTHVNQQWDLSETEIPTTARFAIDCTTAVPNLKAIVIDELVLTERVQLYPGGPGITIVRGTKDYRTGDKFTITYAHSASPPVNEFQFMFEQLLGISSYNLNIPIYTSETIADSLIA